MRSNYFNVNHNIIGVLDEYIQDIRPTLGQLHKQHSQKIWISLLDMIIVYYFNSFMIACKNPKSIKFTDLSVENHKLFLDALKMDLETISIQFSNFVLPHQLQ